jgi:hypothetical protein
MTEEVENALYYLADKIDELLAYLKEWKRE